MIVKIILILTDLYSHFLCFKTLCTLYERNQLFGLFKILFQGRMGKERSFKGLQERKNKIGINFHNKSARYDICGRLEPLFCSSKAWNGIIQCRSMYSQWWIVGKKCQIHLPPFLFLV